MTRLPFQHPSVEKESNLGVFRVAAGLRVREFCDTTGMSVDTYNRLNSGEFSPIRNDTRGTGKIRAGAQEAADFFKCSLSDLFPRYFCELYRNDHPLVDSQLVNIGGGPAGYNEDPAYQYEINQELKLVVDRVKKISKGGNTLIRKSLGMTLEEISKIEGITKQAIHQIHERCMRLIKDGKE